LFLAVACSDDDSGDGNLGGSAGAGSAQGGSSGNAGNAGSSGSANGGTGGSSGSAGTAGSGATGGAAGSAGSSAGGTGGSGDEGDAGPGPDAGTSQFVLTSPAFDDNAGCGPDDRDACDLFPDDNIGLGTARNVSPQIDWVGAPAGTQSFAIALHDLTFIQNDSPFTHWVVWNIPASSTGLPAELPRGTSPGVPADDTGQIGFNAGDIGYEGSGQCGNVYEFVLYALSTPSFEPSSTDSPDDVEAELELSDDVLDTTTMHARSDPNGPTCN